MENDRPTHSGLLQIPPTGKLILKKTWQTKFCLLYKASKSGIARLELFESSEEAPNKTPIKIITLEDCIKVCQKTSRLFTIVKKTAVYEYSAMTDSSLKEWVNALQTVAFGDDSVKQTLVEDNELYCSVDEGLFLVKICQTDAALRCRLEPTDYYSLVLTPTAIRLHDISNKKVLYTWPYQYIRRYGCKGERFTFEAGRKCDSGEGSFYIEYPNAQEINRCISKKMKEMKKVTEKSDTSINCGEKQMQAVLSKEARSRSPLPPSPTSTSLKDIEHISQLSMLDSFDKLSSRNGNNVSTVISAKEMCKPLVKPKPVGLKPKVPKPPPKPPRKCLSHKETDKDDYETIDKYDSVQLINDAWKTLGTTVINHQEHFEDEAEYCSWGQKTSVSNQNAQNISIASKVIMDTDDDTDYDKLDHFGSSSKLNNSGYKQIYSVPNTRMIYSPPSSNDYERVETFPSFESIRQADDSHLGYAVIKKKEKVQHEVVNDDHYAMVSKPKHD